MENKHFFVDAVNLETLFDLESAVFLGRTDFTAQHTDISMSTPLNDAAAPCTDHS